MIESDNEIRRSGESKVDTVSRKNVHAYRLPLILLEKILGQNYNAHWEAIMYVAANRICQGELMLTEVPEEKWSEIKKFKSDTKILPSFIGQVERSLGVENARATYMQTLKMADIASENLIEGVVLETEVMKRVFSPGINALKRLEQNRGSPKMLRGQRRLSIPKNTEAPESLEQKLGKSTETEGIHRKFIPTSPNNATNKHKICI